MSGKTTQLMLMMLASCLLKSAQSNLRNHSGGGFCKRLEICLSGKTTQLMLVMLASCLLKSAQSLGRWVLQASGA